MGGGQCPVGLATAMEEEQLAVQNQTYLGHHIVARYCCLARKVVFKNTM